MSRYCKHGAFQSDCNLCDPVGGSDLSAANCSAFIETTSEMTGEGFVSGVKFTVGVQSFMLAYEGSDEDAKWMATQLAIALRAGGMNVVLSSLIKPNVPAHPIEPPQQVSETPAGKQVTENSDSPERRDLGAAPCSAVSLIGIDEVSGEASRLCEVKVVDKYLSRPDVILKCAQRLIEEAKLKKIDLNKHSMSFQIQKSDQSIEQYTYL